MSALRLPVHEGRGPRVALLVYNDAHSDARVLKEAASLREAGAEVAVFAVARSRAGFPEGEALAGEAIPVHRVREFSLDVAAPALARMRDRLVGAERPTPTLSRMPAESGPEGFALPSSSDTVNAAPPSSSIMATADRAKALVGGAASDLAMRAFRTVALADFSARIVDAVVAWRPDVVHANDANTLAPALRIVSRTRAALVYDSHELWLHRNVRSDRPIAPLVEAMIERAGIRRADAVLTVSPSIVDWLVEHYAMATPPVLVRNVPEAGPLPDPSRGQLRALAGLDADARIIAYGGRATTSRGLEETIDALALLPADLHLVMLGYGEANYLETLWERARALGVRGRVHLVGPVAPHEVADALSDADLAVVHVRPTCLSYRFALPNKLFESIRGGLPVAAADLPDIRGVVESLGVGRLFDGEDPADLAATIEAILDDPEPYRAAARVAAPTLTWERESVGVIAAYRRVLLGERA